MGNTKHGMKDTPEFRAWREIKYRCNTETAQAYHLYGGRGISIHKDWQHDFLSFFNHIGPRPSPAHSIDRIDNNKGYEPGNVRWATKKEQANNRSVTQRLECAGVIMPISIWAEIFGVKLKTLDRGYRKGIPLEYYIKKYIHRTPMHRTASWKKLNIAA